jgi:beta-galactosidase/beta-glucuronidase
MRASLQSLDEMISAGFNSPSILIWAFNNEGPDNSEAACAAYELVAQRIRQRDPSRLVSWASRYGAASQCDRYADIIARNVYPGWSVPLSFLV